ncbi:MAG: extracellular solute-binding protein [Eubacterium sp.]|nr:extracellular solute-binding protein [Eubacterium sp.]
MQFKRILAAVMAGCTLVSLAACSSSSGGTSSQTTETSSEEESSIDDDIRNPVDVSNVSLEITENEIEPAELTYLGNYNITTAGDIKPAYKYFEETYGCTIKCKIVSSSAIQERLSTMIASDESPDLMDYADNVFPLMMSKSMLTPLEDYIDMSAPQWEGLDSYINKYTWAGHNYYYPWSYSGCPYYLIYNRGLYQQLGISDPKELYDEGKWDWNAFKSCLQSFVDSGENRYGLYGYTATAMFDSTGVPLISIGDDGMLKANLVDPNIERAANFMQDLKREDLAIFPEGYINVDTDPIVSGISAFQAMGGWIIANYCHIMEDDEALDIFFVPFPRDPSADEYYMTMSTFGYLVPANAKHVEQATVFINCCRLSKLDEALKEETKKSEMKDKAYTEEQYDFMTALNEAEGFVGVIDEPYGMDDTTATLIRQMIDNVIFTQSDEELNNKSWTQMREENGSAIDSQVEYYNNLIKNSNGVAD